ELGRFISPDPTIQHPYDPQDFNRYAYCRNNPVKYVDATGLGFWDIIGDIIGGILGFAVGVVTGNPALGVATYAAISAGMSAVSNGYNVFQAMGIAAGAGIIGFAGGCLGTAYGGWIGAGTWGTSFLAGMAGGAAGGASGALLSGGNVGMGALSGAASGATLGAFGGIGGRLGNALGPMFGMPLAGVAGAAVSGGNIGEGAISGAAAWYGSIITRTIAIASTPNQHRSKSGRSLGLPDLIEQNSIDSYTIEKIGNRFNLTVDESIQIAGLKDTLNWLAKVGLKKGTKLVIPEIGGLYDVIEYIAENEQLDKITIPQQPHVMDVYIDRFQKANEGIVERKNNSGQ
ncbi:MAG: RHS repeat-associated core domain-containing protein, partial [Candidatus Omnitrophota bacterium]